MKILVTGGAGYIGSTLVPMLLVNGHRVRVLDSLMYGGQSLLGSWSHPNFQFRKADIRDCEAVSSALEGIEAVIHLAAIVGDPACARQPEQARLVNLNSSLALLDRSKNFGVSRFVFASTCSNYGRMKDPSQYVDENTDLRPVSLYATTKVSVERAVLDPANSERLCATSLRFATVFGASSRMRFDLTVNEFTMKLLIERKLAVYGEQFWRPYIHVRDVGQSILMVLNAPEEKIRGQVFNVGDTSQNYQKGQLVNLIRSRLSGEVEIKYVRGEEDPRDYRVSFEKIKRELGFCITRRVEDGIQEIIDLIKHSIMTDFENTRYRN